MALRRCTRSVDGTIPIPALLYADEELLATQKDVGIYDGLQKSPDHQAGTIHATTHRLFYIDAQDESTRSFAMDLSYISQTEYYAGLFKSSPKVTLHLSVSSSSTPVSGASDALETGFESWECEVCAYRNPPGLSPAAARICALCGVPRASVPSPLTPAPAQQLSTSLPSSSLPSAFNSSTSIPSSSSTHGRRPSTIACPACTFLNHASMRTCEICSGDLPRIQRAMKSAPSSRPASPDLDDDEDAKHMLKLSFRKGGVQAFYTVLKRSLKSKAWEGNGIAGKSRPSANPLTDPMTSNRSGITGILQNVETSAQGRTSNMTDALQDLEALMVKAKDMVRLAAELNERLTAASSSTASPVTSDSSAPSLLSSLSPSAEPEEATFIRSSLSQLGLQMANTPVTQDMMKDERKWIEELARELARVLQGSPSATEGTGMMRQRGIIALDEVWGGWNRARGVALIPPSTFLQVIPHLPSYTTPTIRSRTLTSGLSVLHTPPYSHTAFTARLSGLLVMAGPKTTTEIAQDEGITVGLASEMIAAVEGDGDVCRDDIGSVIRGGSAGGVHVEVRWWANLFVGYVWDGQD